MTNHLDKVEPIYYNESGKGRKHCNSCDKYIPARLLECYCGNSEFIKAVINKKPQEIIKPNFWGNLVFTPSGECPFKLSSTNKEDVRNWCETVFRYGLKNGKTYTSGALKYWIRTLIKDDLRDIVDEWAAEEGYEKNISNEPES